MGGSHDALGGPLSPGNNSVVLNQELKHDNENFIRQTHAYIQLRKLVTLTNHITFMSIQVPLKIEYWQDPKKNLQCAIVAPVRRGYKPGSFSRGVGPATAVGRADGNAQRQLL